MNARHGCWTIPQLLLDLETRVKALEEANQPVYVHHVCFQEANIRAICLDILNVTDTLFTSDTLLAHLMSLPNNTNIMCSGFTATDDAIVKLSRQDNLLIAGMPDSEAYSFTTLTLVTDYVEPIRS